jgi:hypothetical protein
VVQPPVFPERVYIVIGVDICTTIHLLLPSFATHAYRGPADVIVFVQSTPFVVGLYVPSYTFDDVTETNPVPIRPRSGYTWVDLLGDTESNILVHDWFDTTLVPLVSTVNTYDDVEKIFGTLQSGAAVLTPANMNGVGVLLNDRTTVDLAVAPA